MEMLVSPDHASRSAHNFALLHPDPLQNVCAVMQGDHSALGPAPWTVRPAAAANAADAASTIWSGTTGGIAMSGTQRRDIASRSGMRSGDPIATLQSPGSQAAIPPARRDAAFSAKPANGPAGQIDIHHSMGSSSQIQGTPSGLPAGSAGSAMAPAPAKTSGSRRVFGWIKGQRGKLIP